VLGEEAELAVKNSKGGKEARGLPRTGVENEKMSTVSCLEKLIGVLLRRNCRTRGELLGGGTGEGL